MDSDSWARAATFSRRRASRSEVYNGEGHELEEESNPEYVCPFCAEDFDMLGFCCHIDEMHPVQAKNGIFYDSYRQTHHVRRDHRAHYSRACPVCARNVGPDLVRHLTGQHASVLKVPRRRRFLRRGLSSSPFSSLRRELREGNLQSLISGASLLGSSSHAEPDPMLTSFILSSPVVDKSSSVQSPSVEDNPTINHSVQSLDDRSVRLSDEDLREKAQRCDFVQGLLLSTFLDERL